MEIKLLKLISNEETPKLRHIEAFEMEHNLKLPEAFKQFLLWQNPIITHEKYFKHFDNFYQINAFYPFIYRKNHNNLSIQQNFENLKDFYLSKYLPFADDGGGWEYVISLQEEGYGKVYFCRMDEELEDALTLLADSFEDFINGLQESSEE